MIPGNSHPKMKRKAPNGSSWITPVGESELPQGLAHPISEIPCMFAWQRYSKKKIQFNPLQINATYDARTKPREKCVSSHF